MIYLVNVFENPIGNQAAIGNKIITPFLAIWKFSQKYVLDRAWV